MPSNRTVAIAILLLIGAAIAVLQRVERPARPNVLLIVWDTVRADRLSCYDDELRTTPWLRRFSEDAVVFERAISPAMWTLPSHASLFTGMPVTAHGTSSHHKWLNHGFVTAAEALEDVGYNTYAFSSNPFVSERTNLLQGFSDIDYSYEGRWAERCRVATEQTFIPSDRSTEVSLLRNIRKNERKIRERGSRKNCGPGMREAFFDWLEQRPTEAPFFAYLNYMYAHVPRTPSIEARRQTMSEEQLQRSLELDQTLYRNLLHMFGIDRFSEEDLNVARAVYDASLIDLDAETGKLVDELEHRGLLDNTIVILTSDHGENLGDHDLFGHKYCLYDTLTRVPLVVRYPKRLEPRRVRGATPVFDVYATILDVAGVEIPDPRVQSVSLLSDTDRDRAARPVYSEMIGVVPMALQRVSAEYPDFDWKPWLRSMRSAEQDGFKIIEASDGRTELYDISADPGELGNLTQGMPERANQLKKTLDGWLAGFEHYDPSTLSNDDRPAEFPPRIRERLRLLGYIEE